MSLKRAELRPHRKLRAKGMPCGCWLCHKRNGLTDPEAKRRLEIARRGRHDCQLPEGL